MTPKEIKQRIAAGWELYLRIHLFKTYGYLKKGGKILHVYSDVAEKLKVKTPIFECFTKVELKENE